MTEKTTFPEKQKLQDKIQKMQAKLRAIEAREKEKEAKKLAKAKDDLFKVLVDLGLSGVEPAKLKSFLSQHKAALLETQQEITSDAGGLTDNEADHLNHIRDKTPAEPMKFE